LRGRKSHRKGQRRGEFHQVRLPAVTRLSKTRSRCEEHRGLILAEVQQ
jgi:hypothetical protein